MMFYALNLFSIISEIDRYDKNRFLSIVVNYRSKAGLPQNILGNFVSTINILTNEKVDSSQLAQELRAAIDNFQELHMNSFPTQNYIKQKGGIKKSNRFILKGIAPLKRSLLVTNWSNFGVYHVIFGQSKPFYFGYFGDSPFPWLSSITEGFSNSGLIYSISLPRKLAMNLIQSDNLQKIHRYRAAKEVMPEIVEKSKWLL